jgi:SET domain-containing protein
VNTDTTGTSGNQKGTSFEPRLALAESSIDGKGVFSLDFIRVGTPVIQCAGLIQAAHELEPYVRAMQIGPDTYLVEDPQQPSLDDFLNHSCRPNLGFIDGSLMLYALYDIQPGEELTFDYSTSMDEVGWKLRCRCGAPNCRRLVRRYSELPEQDQKRLRNIALAYLR